MTQLHRTSWGSGGRRALLLHGSTSSAATWWRVGPALARRGWTVEAVDLPGHGGSPGAAGPLLPATVLPVLQQALDGRVFDVVVGHSWGAAVAVGLLSADAGLARAAVLEELPGPRSVDWAAEAAAVPPAADEARRRPDDVLARTRAEHPRWAPEDCRHAVTDLARCQASAVAAGLAEGATWLPEGLAGVSVPVRLLLAPDAPGVNRLEDATALRGPEREWFTALLGATVQVAAGGHCVHRDDPAAWSRAVDAVTVS